MINRVNFEDMVNRAIKSVGSASIRPVIEKELLHYDILFALDNHGLLDGLTFQGGTSLRLCYGSSRLSEDLDFTGGVNFSAKEVEDIRDCIVKYVGKRYDLLVEVKEPKDLEKDIRYQDLKILKWQVAVTTSPERKDIPKQKIKIEVANVPSYTRIPKALTVNYDMLPDGYGDTLIMVQTLNEIMTDKVISLPNTQNYVRHRDIWDLRWLKQQGASVELDLLDKKIIDYKIDNYRDKVIELKSRLPEIIRGENFLNELKRFIPVQVQERTIKKEKFLTFLETELNEIFEALH